MARECACCKYVKALAAARLDFYREHGRLPTREEYEAIKQEMDYMRPTINTKKGGK